MLRLYPLAGKRQLLRARKARGSGVPLSGTCEPARQGPSPGDSTRVPSRGHPIPWPHRRRVKVIAVTRIAPEERRARAQEERVAPVVRTSSIRRTLRGTWPRAWIRGGWPMRWARRLPTWRPPPRRVRQASRGSSARRARAPAISAAGSKPRIAERRGAVGTGTRAPLSRVAGASHWMRSAIRSATGSRRRNFRAATSSRATSSCGDADQALSSPAAPTPTKGSVAASRRAQRLQRTASWRHPRPQVAQSGGTRAVARVWRRFTRRSLASAARAWRAKGQMSVRPL